MSGFTLNKVKDLQNDTSLRTINDNFYVLFQKVFGNIGFGDVTKGISKQLFSYPLQIEGEGNIDATHPLYIRFFIPEDTTKINNATINAITSRYRMDSSVAKTCDSSIKEAATTTGASSMETTEASDTTTSQSQSWLSKNGMNSWEYPVVDGAVTIYLGDFDHTHDMSHHHGMAHVHSVNFTVDIEGHSHDLDEGIKESDEVPDSVAIYVNNAIVGATMTGDNKEQNNIDIKDQLLIGKWNVIKVTAANVSRITIYGIASLINAYV